VNTHFVFITQFTRRKTLTSNTNIVPNPNNITTLGSNVAKWHHTLKNVIFCVDNK